MKHIYARSKATEIQFGLFARRNSNSPYQLSLKVLDMHQTNTSASWQRHLKQTLSGVRINLKRAHRLGGRNAGGSSYFNGTVFGKGTQIPNQALTRSFGNHRSKLPGNTCHTNQLKRHSCLIRQL